MILSAVTGSALQASEERRELAQWMASFEEKAAHERREAAQAAEAQRQHLLQSQQAEAAKAAAERLTMFDAITKLTQALGAQRGTSPVPLPPQQDVLASVQAMMQQQQLQFAAMLQQVQHTAGGAPAARARAKSQGVDSSDDDESDGAATDVDDDSACAEAIKNWRSRTKNVQKSNQHTVAWIAETIPDATFVAAWARRVDCADDGNVRNTVEGVALLQILTDLHRALSAHAQGKANVGLYAVKKALQTTMQMAMRLEMRATASTQAMNEFDQLIATNDRKCRHRHYDNMSLQQLADQAKKKHPRQRREAGGRRGGRRGDDKDAADPSNSRASSVASKRGGKDL